MQSRRTFLASAAAPAVLRAQRPKDPPPNVVLIITDDQGFGDLSCHGNPHLRTPHIDSIARGGVEFTQFHVSPVCAPTRASLMTGRYNYRTRVVDTFLGRAMMDPEEVTLAEMLASAGYRTGIFGKWHLGDNHPMRPMDQGFQESVVHLGGGLGQPSDLPGGSSYFDPLVLHNGRPRRYNGYCTDVFTNEAIAFIEQNRSRPFFTYLATNAPHTPLEVAEELAAPYRAQGLDDTTAKVYGMVQNLDGNVGRLLARLRKLDLEQNTILIFMTDNGPQQPRYNAGMRGRKGAVYEGGIRVPFFIRWPRRLRAGGRIGRLAAHIDVAPTLLEACGAARPPAVDFDGVSLMPLLSGEKKPWPERTLYFQWHRGDRPEPFRASAARGERYKLVDGKELYDLENDPAEKADVAASNPRIVARMRKGYEEWFRDVSSSRGYDPPRIYLGTSQENPVRLTRQDWRGPKAGWGAESVGHWEVDVRAGGRYHITLSFRARGQAGAAKFRLNGAELQKPYGAAAGSVTFENVAIPPGPGRLEAMLISGASETGVHSVEVNRLG